MNFDSSRALADRITRFPTEFVLNGHRLIHRTSRVVLSIGGGVFALCPHPDSSFTFHLSLFGRFRLWRVVKAWLGWNLIQKLSAPAVVESSSDH